MTVIVRRTDCQCGGITGLFFSRIVVERFAPEPPTGDGIVRGGLITELHFPHDGAFSCKFFFDGTELSPERVRTMIVNNAEARVAEIAGLEASSKWDPVIGGTAAGRAAEMIERYAEMPDNP